jgi:hypothetical protein
MRQHIPESPQRNRRNRHPKLWQIALEKSLNEMLPPRERR